MTGQVTGGQKPREPCSDMSYKKNGKNTHKTVLCFCFSIFCRSLEGTKRKQPIPGAQFINHLVRGHGRLALCSHSALMCSTAEHFLPCKATASPSKSWPISSEWSQQVLGNAGIRFMNPGQEWAVRYQRGYSTLSVMSE